MKRKRFIKLLMKDGYSRNDARACADYVVFKCRRVSENNALAKVIFDDGRRIDINRYSYAAEFALHSESIVKMGELMRRAMEEAIRNPPNDKIVRKIRLTCARSNSRISTLGTLEIAARKCELNLEGVDY